MKKFLAILLATAILAAGCTPAAPTPATPPPVDAPANNTPDGTTSPAAPDGPMTIGIALPTQREERWVLDKEAFESIAAEMGVAVAIQIADNDAARQQNQVENLIAQGVSALIVAAHDGTAARSMVELAHGAGIPIIAYERLITDSAVDLFITFDSFMTGYLMGQYIVDTVESGNIVLLKGDPQDSTSAILREGSMAAMQEKLDSGAYTIVMEMDCRDWAPSEALRHMEQALTANDNDIQGVIAPNDGTAGGVIQALAAQGLAGHVPVTGQDAEVDAIKRIIEGTQGMTVFGDVRELAVFAFQTAVDMASGGTAPSTDVLDNGAFQTPVYRFPGTTVTQQNWEEVVVNSGYMTMDQLQ